MSQYSEEVRMEFDLVVTSGKIIVSDDLRPVYRVPDEIERNLPSYNTTIGQAQYVQEMAKLGCAYGPVGNSCPTLYRVGDGKLVIASSGWEGQYGEWIDQEGEALAHIITDLWAYSIADYGDWTSKGGHVNSWAQTIVPIENGTYHFVHHTGEASFDADATDRPIVFADIEKVA